MNAVLEFCLPFSEAMIDRLGWVLVHSLWQFTLVALLAAVAMRVMRRSSAKARSGVLIGLLMLSIVFPIVTWMLQSSEPMIATARPGALQESPNSDAPPIVDQPIDTSIVHSTEETAEVSEAVRAAPALVFNTPVDTPTRSTWTERATVILRPWLAWAVGFWGLGVVLCSLRPLVGWLTLRRLKRVGVSPASKEVLASLTRVSKRMGLRRSVRVLESSLAQVPLVVGYLKPVILLPASLLTNIPPTQLEAILAHELAHIRRHDFVVNLLQILIETLFFYHPAVWWLSHRIRAEREHCCDDLAVRVMDNRTEYGRALIAIEEFRGRSSVFALGASDGSMLHRVRRIAGHPSERTGISVWTSLFLIVSLAGIVLVMILPGNSGVTAMAEDKITEDPLPASSTLRFGTSRFRHGIPVSTMAVSADGKMAFVANDNHMQGFSRAFDLASGRVLYSLRNIGGIQVGTISPDGRAIVTKQGPNLNVRDADTGKELRTIEGPPTNSPRGDSWSWNEWLAFTPDGKAIALATRGRPKEGIPAAIHLIDFESGKTIRDFSHDNPESDLSASFSTILGIALSQDGKLMASGGFDNDKGIYFARLWEVETGRELRRFMHSKRSYGIRSLAFSPDAKTLATRSHDGRLRLFDVDTGKGLKTFPKDGGGRKHDTVAFAPDGKTVAAAGDSIRLYDVTTGEERLRIGRKQASHLEFTDGGKTLTGAVKGAIYRWDTATGKSLTPEAGDSIVEQILVTPDGNRVVTRGQRGDVHIWDGTNGKHLRRLDDTVWQQDLAMSPDGRFLVWPVEDESIYFPDPHNPNLGYDGARIRLYDIAADKNVDRFPGFKGHAQNLTFTHGGKQLVTVDHRDGMVRIWNFDAGKEERSFRIITGADAEKHPPHRLSRTVLSPDGKTLAVTYQANIQRGLLMLSPHADQLWDVATGKQRLQLNKDQSYVTAFSPDSRFFVTGSGVVSETATGERIAALPGEPYIRALALSRDGRFLATAVSGNLIHVWEVATWTKRSEFKGHPDRTTTLTFAPGGLLLSGSLDTTVLAWDLRPPRPTVKVSLDAAWTDLAKRESAKAFRAEASFLAAAPDAVKLFAERIEPAQALDVKRVQRLIADLDSEQFKGRDSASKALSELGRRVKPYLEKAIKTTKSNEVRDRARVILKGFQRVAATPHQLRQMRAVHVLELIGDNESKHLLKKWSDGPAGTLLTVEASAALKRLK